jgi:hypothetical protein
MPTLPPIEGAIAIAEAILPGKKAPPGKIDVRWQAIILVGAYIETHPNEVCDFAIRWAKHRSLDLQSAISCCLIEHLLEHHFDLLFPKLREAALSNAKVAEHFCPYSRRFKFGHAQLPKNASRLKRLASELDKKWNKNNSKH